MQKKMQTAQVITQPLPCCLMMCLAFWLVGPWCVGVLRQGEVGAIPETSTNLKVARRLYERNERRMGSAPIDYTMAKAVDQLCSAAFGMSPRLTFWLRVYKTGIVGLCLDRLCALKDATEIEIARYQGEGGGGNYTGGRRRRTGLAVWHPFVFASIIPKAQVQSLSRRNITQ